MKTKQDELLDLYALWANSDDDIEQILDDLNSHVEDTCCQSTAKETPTVHKDHLGQTIEQDCQTFTVYCVTEWTNNIIRLETDVPIDGVDLLAEQMLFEAWDNPGGPITVEVYKRPEPYDGSINDRVGTFVDRHDARQDGHPTPVMTTPLDDPTLPARRPIL